ncbi:MAG: hypothetical protein AB7L70_19270 [Pyrinomonadaceae bacterium]
MKKNEEISKVVNSLNGLLNSLDEVGRKDVAKVVMLIAFGSLIKGVEIEKELFPVIMEWCFENIDFRIDSDGVPHFDQMWPDNLI